VSVLGRGGAKRTVGLPGLAAGRRVSEWRRSLATAQLVARRSATATSRLLPNVMILGAQKAGTTMLFALLARHPMVLTSCIKEVHYFDLHYGKGIDWYRAHFPLSREVEEPAAQSRSSVVLEASPYYLFHPAVPSRVAQAIPNARFIVLLRDPVARAWSHYWHERTRGYEWRLADAAFQCEAERLRGQEQRLLAEPSYRSHAHRHFSYLARSRYANQLERWFAQFRRSQFLVLRSEDLFASPADTVSLVLRFLMLPDDVDLPRESHLAAHSAGAYPPIPNPLLRRLTGELEDSNAALQTLLGSAFSW
jgi:Sulfotransferase domain